MWKNCEKSNKGNKIINRKLFEKYEIYNGAEKPDSCSYTQKPRQQICIVFCNTAQ